MIKGKSVYINKYLQDIAEGKTEITIPVSTKFTIHTLPCIYLIYTLIKLSTKLSLTHYLKFIFVTRSKMSSPTYLSYKNFQT